MDGAVQNLFRRLTRTPTQRIRSSLLSYLATYAYSYRTEAFTLASGQKSHEYLDCRVALSRPEVLAAAGQCLLREVRPEVRAVGGLTMGADPLAIGVSMISGRRALSWFSVRKEAKEHGKKQKIEGFVRPGMGICVLEDVVTTGSSTIAAIRACQEANLSVHQVLALVDREAGGMDHVRDAILGVPAYALFCVTDIRSAYLAQVTDRHV